MSTPTTSATYGASAKASEPVPHPASSAASVPVNGPSRRRTRSARSALRLLLQREPQLDAHVVASRAASSRASASASSRVEIVPAARSSSMASRIRPIAGPGSRPELVSANERRRRIGAPSRLDDARRAPARRRTRARRAPTAPSSTKAVDRARRRILGPARPPKRRRVALQLVRDRKPREGVAEDDHEPEVGIVERVEAARRAVRRAARAGRRSSRRR